MNALQGRLCGGTGVACALDYVCRGNDILTRGNEILCRGNELLFRGNKILCRGDDILTRVPDILTRGSELHLYYFVGTRNCAVGRRDYVVETSKTFRGISISCRRNEMIISWERGIISWERDTFALFRKNEKIISWKRDINS